jgi:Kef-type K+ transport system membrane component KefB
MWIILISLAVGVIIGILGVIPKRYVKYNSKFQQIGVILLLFSMGASIGSNKEMIMHLKSLGLKAITFAILTSFFSILITYIVSSKFIGEGSKK